jgi:hypothetical protein
MEALLTIHRFVSPDLSLWSRVLHAADVPRRSDPARGVVHRVADLSAPGVIASLERHREMALTRRATTSTIEHVFVDGVSVEDLRSQEEALAGVCQALDPEAIPLPDAPAAYASLARIERLAAGAKLRLAGRVAESDVWRRAGRRSPAEHLAHLGGTSRGAAQQELDTAGHLASSPATSAALRAGELSAAQAAAVADATVADPSAEVRLVELAQRASLRQLREECTRVRAAADPDAEARYARIRRQRALRTFCDSEGTWNLQARGPVDDGARIMAALGPLIDQVFQRARVDGLREAHEAYAFDALVALADQPATTSSGSTPSTRTRSQPKFRGLLRVDLEALTRGEVHEGECCEITGVGPVPVSVARRLLGDSILHLVLTRGHDVASVVHLGRGPTAAQQIALLWTQPECARLGCDQTWTHAQIDHRTPWADTQQTVLDELDRLCPFDHRLKTHHGWALVAGSGKRLMVPPGHPLHPDLPESTSDPPPATFVEPPLFDES